MSTTSAQQNCLSPSQAAAPAAAVDAAASLRWMPRPAGTTYPVSVTSLHPQHQQLVQQYGTGDVKIVIRPATASEAAQTTRTPVASQQTNNGTKQGREGANHHGTQQKPDCLLLPPLPTEILQWSVLFPDEFDLDGFSSRHLQSTRNDSTLFLATYPPPPPKSLPDRAIEKLKSAVKDANSDNNGSGNNNNDSSSTSALSATATAVAGSATEAESSLSPEKRSKRLWKSLPAHVREFLEQHLDSPVLSIGWTPARCTVDEICSRLQLIDLLMIDPERSIVDWIVLFNFEIATARHTWLPKMGYSPYLHAAFPIAFPVERAVMLKVFWSDFRSNPSYGFLHYDMFFNWVPAPSTLQWHVLGFRLDSELRHSRLPQSERFTKGHFTAKHFLHLAVHGKWTLEAAIEHLGLDADVARQLQLSFNDLVYNPALRWPANKVETLLSLTRQLSPPSPPLPTPSFPWAGDRHPRQILASIINAAKKARAAQTSSSAASAAATAAAAAVDSDKAGTSGAANVPRLLEGADRQESRYQPPPPPSLLPPPPPPQAVPPLIYVDPAAAAAAIATISRPGTPWPQGPQSHHKHHYYHQQPLPHHQHDYRRQQQQQSVHPRGPPLFRKEQQLQEYDAR